MQSDIKLILLQYTYGFIHFTEATHAGNKAWLCTLVNWGFLEQARCVQGFVAFSSLPNFFLLCSIHRFSNLNAVGQLLQGEPIFVQVSDKYNFW